MERYVFSVKAKAILMLDGIDEISPRHTELALNLRLWYKIMPNFVKILITTKPNVIQEGEENCK